MRSAIFPVQLREINNVFALGEKREKGKYKKLFAKVMWKLAQNHILNTIFRVTILLSWQKLTISQ